jgi:hypothetical protein
MKTSKYSFAVEKACRSLKEGEKELWTLTVRLKHLPRGLKYGPNARYATLDSKPAKEMLNTLSADPKSFVYKNNGIMIVADSVKVDGLVVEMWCQEPDTADTDDVIGHGVLNGGHTYMVLQHVLESDDERHRLAVEETTVLITLAIGISPDDIASISRARNTSQSVPLHALRNLAGDWSILRKHLPAEVRKRVAFKPNDPEAPDAEYDTTDLVRRIALLNNEMFPAQEGIHPVIAYNAIGTLVSKYRQEDFVKIAHVLPDAIELETMVVKRSEAINGRGQGKYAISIASGCSKENRTLLSGYEAELSLADPFVLPVIAAFRVFIKDGRWHKPLPELWEKYGPKTVSALWDAYRESGKSSAAVFGRTKASWAAACDLTKSAAIQLGVIKVV